MQALLSPISWLKGRYTYAFTRHIFERVQPEVFRMDKSEKLAAIKVYHGASTIFLHGKSVFGTFLRTVTPSAAGFPNEACVRQYAVAGIHFYSIDAGTYSNPPEWVAPGTYDFSQVITKFKLMALRMVNLLLQSSGRSSLKPSYDERAGL